MDNASLTTDMASWTWPARYKMLARLSKGTSRYWSGTKCNARRTHSTPFGPCPTTRQYSAARLYSTQLGPIFYKHTHLMNRKRKFRQSRQIHDAMHFITGYVSGKTVDNNKYERYYWTRKAPACLLTLLCHCSKPRLCINIHHYAPPIGCSVTHRAATTLAAADLSVLVKFQCQVLNRQHETSFANYSLIRN